MSSLPDQSSWEYRALIQQMAQSMPGYRALNKFLNVKQSISQSPARLSVVTINSGNTPGCTPNINFKDFDGIEDLARELGSHREPNTSCRLFIAEDICPQTITLLGGHFDVDPQFFSDHVNNTPWYRINDVADRLPVLPSAEKAQDFLQLRYIECMSFAKGTSKNSSSATSELRKCHPRRLHDGSLDALPDARNPNRVTTRIPRRAGIIIPWAREGRDYEPVLCTRQVVTVWFQARKITEEGWTGILLLDPQFKLPRSSPYYLTSSHSWRDQHYSAPKAGTGRGSNRKTYLDYLKNVFANNTSLLVATQNEPFLILEYIYRLTASHWLVMNEYINRELATIEYILEHEDSGFQDLETYMKDLYVHRRRCTKYHDLIKQTKEQCVKRGQNSWPKDTPSPLAEDHSKSLEDDFTFCLFKIRETANRIEKSINLFTALVTIEEGKQGLDENRGLAWLSLLATIFLPFSTVATILAMQGSYAPGGGQFWIFLGCGYSTHCIRRRSLPLR